MKKLVFVSNRNNNHQEALAREFWKIYGSDYTYVAMTPVIAGERAPEVRDQNYEPYVLRAYESSEAMSEAQILIDEAECVIVGGNPKYILTVRNRLKRGKLTFLYSERFLKGPLWKDVARFLTYSACFGVRSYAQNARSKFFLLCASAFAAWDYNACGLFRNKAYRWGYFPKIRYLGQQISRIEASGFGS